MTARTDALGAAAAGVLDALKPLIDAGDAGAAAGALGMVAGALATLTDPGTFMANLSRVAAGVIDGSLLEPES